MDPRTFNRELDEQLLATGVVDENMFRQFWDAYTYDAASTVGWVGAKIRVLASRLNSGAGLKLYEPSLRVEIEVSSAQEFSSWVQKHFPLAQTSR